VTRYAERPLPRDVERDRSYTPSELASDIYEMLRIASRGHDAVAGPESLFCEGSAKTARSFRN